ncbi:MAG: hypothetical protein LQ338_001233 [Usnochroma carphineum]|nr:MAG: hypothetical protein LQ338_001233 [Usnochroma carphineum]
MLFQTSLLISTAAILSYVHCAPASNQLSARGWKTTTALAGACIAAGPCDPSDDSEKPPEVSIDPGTAPTNEAQITCSAKDGTHKDVVEGANTTSWVTSMERCLTHLDVDNWVDNYSCQPNDGGPLLGPASFGFYSKGHDWRDMRNCYKKCSPCLTEGIDNHWAVTTSCKYDAGGGSSCEMGFNYGK